MYLKLNTEHWTVSVHVHESQPLNLWVFQSKHLHRRRHCLSVYRDPERGRSFSVHESVLRIGTTDG